MSDNTLKTNQPKAQKINNYSSLPKQVKNYNLPHTNHNKTCPPL